MVEITPAIKFVAAINPVEALDMLGLTYDQSLISPPSYWVWLPDHIKNKQDALKFIQELGLVECASYGFVLGPRCAIRVHAWN